MFDPAAHQKLLDRKYYNKDNVITYYKVWNGFTIELYSFATRECKVIIYKDGVIKDWFIRDINTLLENMNYQEAYGNGKTWEDIITERIGN